MLKYFTILCLSLLCITCKESEEQKIEKLVTEWQDKTIAFPETILFTRYGIDTMNVNFSTSTYKILTYVDTIGCTSCKLQLPRWLEFIHELDSLTDSQTPVLFFLNSKNYKEVSNIFKRDDFNHPVCFDKRDSLNKLNHFPSDMMFQTFLLDSTNRVKVIGNPILNSKIKELYLNVITGQQKVADYPQTTTDCDVTEIDFGSFPKEEIQKRIFTIKNSGINPLLIADVVTSCGCISVKYSKQPTLSGKTTDITVTMKPESAGYFEKTLSIYCNTPNTPLILKIKGRAE